MNPVMDFANAILHGDEIHREWLIEAAQNFIAGKPVPPARAKLPQPTPTVAKIAAEVAADLQDYVTIDQEGYGFYVGYRTADAQEMIERAFAGLEPKPVSADVEQIAREAAEKYVFNGWLCPIPNQVREKLSAQVSELSGIIQSALAPLQAELVARDALAKYPNDYCFACGGTGGHHEGCKGVSGIMALQAELEQAKEELAVSQERNGFKAAQIQDLRARLATAEADTKRLDWIDAQKKGGMFTAISSEWGVTVTSFRHGAKELVERSATCREAIDKAKGAQS